MNRQLDVPTISLNCPVSKTQLNLNAIDEHSLRTNDTLIASTAINNLAITPFRLINPGKSHQSQILHGVQSLPSNTAECFQPFLSIPSTNCLFKPTNDRTNLTDSWPLQSDIYFPTNIQKSLALIGRFPLIDRQNKDRGREGICTLSKALNEDIFNARAQTKFSHKDWLMPAEKKAFEFVTHKIVHTTALYNLLVKIFLNNTKIEAHELRLSRVEQLLLIEFLKRKFKNLTIDFENKPVLDPSDVTELILRARGEKSTKRIEERKKFVYKHTLKKLKKEFFESEYYRSNAQSKDLFYDYYFREIAQERDLRLENFYDPLNQQTKERVYRTLSNLYLSLLFESTKFKHDFLLYMQSSDFLRDYQRSVDKKIEKLLLKWEELFQKNIPEEAIIKNVKEYFTLNRQCKLPWTVEEVMHAAKSFVKFTNGN